MCVKFQLSVSESSRDIKGIVLSASSVRLQTREWQFDPDSASQRKFPFLPLTAAYIFFGCNGHRCDYITLSMAYLAMVRVVRKNIKLIKTGTYLTK